MGHHFNHNPSKSMKLSTINVFAKRLGKPKGKIKNERIDNLLSNFWNYYLDHTPEHINRMILELKNNNTMTFQEASIIATNEIGI